MPFDLPAGWGWTTLGSVGTWQAGGTPSRSNSSYYGGDIPWLKTGDLNDGYITDIPERITEDGLNNSSAKWNPEGSVLIAMYGATIGKVGILTFPATTNQACCACFEFEGVSNKYLFYFLMSQKEEFLRKAGGGAQPNISKDIIVTTLFPLPPIREQERITAEIEKWFSVVDRLDVDIANLKGSIANAKSAILSLAISGKLVPQDPTDEPAVELLKRINPAFKPCDNPHYENDIPESWCLAQLGDVAEYGETSNVDVASIASDSWVLELEDIEKDTAAITERKIKSERGISGVRHSFKKGQILYSKLRTYLNKVLIAPEDGFCTTEIMPISAGRAILPEYLLMVLRSPYFLEYTASLGYGVKMPRLGTNDAKRALIPIPPYAEQIRIASEVNLYRALIESIHL